MAAATDELADSSQSPKVTLLRGDASVAAISPATAYAEDSVAVSGDFGTMALSVRRDTAAASAADGDYATINTDSVGRLHVALTGVSNAEDAAHVSGDGGIPALVIRKDTPAALGADGDYTLLQTDANGRLHVTATIAAATDVAKAEDAAHVSGDLGYPALIVRKDTPVALGADGDYTLAQSDANGRLHVINSAGVAGTVAHDGADSGNPLKVGYKAVDHGANPTAVAAADRTDAYANRHGVPFVLGGHPNIIARSNLITDGDGAQTNASLAGTISSGTKVVITRLSIYCDNSNSGDVAVKVGFAAATLTSSALAGANGIIFEGSFDGGAGIEIGDGSGIIAIGGDGEELRLTCGDPVAGNLTISYSYFTIES